MILNNNKEKLRDLVLIIPSLNPDDKLVKTVRSMIEGGFSHILIVNDGSDKAHMGPFKWAELQPECEVAGYEENHGKGYALKYAYQYVLDHYSFAKGVVTADGDGQHSAEDTVNVGLKLLEDPSKYVFGCRDFSDPAVPAHNRFGNVTTRLVFRYLLGAKVSDCQTGLRALGTENLPKFLKVDGDRFEYESNAIMKAGSFGVEFAEIPIKTLYLDDNKSSHFRVIKDSYRIYKPILMYIASSIGAEFVDLLVFTILSVLLDEMHAAGYILIATVGARVCSSTFNFFFNKNLVFKAEGHSARSVLRYYATAASMMLLSYGLVTGLTLLFGAEGLLVTLLKACIDLFLFFVNFRIQKVWVFTEKSSEK